jgi:methionine-rich copper-binding protein CopC
MQIDQQLYRQSNGATVALDVNRARQVAADYVSAQAPGVTDKVAADPQQVVVQVNEQVNTSFLRIVGINTVPIRAIAPARIRYGITQANGG